MLSEELPRDPVANVARARPGTAARAHSAARGCADTAAAAHATAFPTARVFSLARRLALVLGGFWLLCASPLAARAEPLFARSGDVVVVRYIVQLPPIAGPDAVRELVVHGDGRVLRREPAGHREAGEAELQLEPAELDALVRSLVERGVDSFDSSSVEREVAGARGARSMVFRSHDASTIAIELELLPQAASADSAQLRASPGAAGSHAALRPKRRTVRWRGLRAAAQRNPGNRSLTDLDDACAELEGLMRDRRFRRRAGGR